MTASPPGDIPLRAVLDTLPAGVAIFDGAGMLQYANPGFWAQAGLGTEALPPGTSSAEVTARLAEAGDFGPVAGAAPPILHHARPHRQLVRSVGGRRHEVTSTPLPGGGSVLLSVDITGVRRSESEAVEHAALLEAILERLDTGVSVTDGASRLTYFNRAYEALIGAGPGGVRLGMTRAELVERLRQAGELDRMAPEDVVNLTLTKVEGTTVFRRERPDGSTLWIRARPVPEGGVLTEVGDVTALRQAEQEAQDRAKLLDGVLSALPHGVLVYGPDKRVRMVNDAYQSIMAGSEVTVGEHMRDIAARRIAQGEYGPDGRDVPPFLVEDRPLPSELTERRRLRPNGTIMTVRIVPLPDGGQVVVMTDVTALTHAEEQAERRAATLRAMLDNQPDGVALFDAQANLIAANALAAQMAGLTEEQMKPGRNLLELRALQVAAKEFGPDAKDAQSFVESRGERLLETRNRYVRRRPDGTVLEVRTDLTPDGGFIRTYRDVTEERRVRAELEAARDAAEAASRTKSGFLATMTHELRTPLHVVIGFSEAILEESRPELIRAHAAEVLAAGQQLLNLVDGLLEATRIEAGTLFLREAVFDPAPILRAASLARRKAVKEAGIDLCLDVPEGLPPMRGDAARLRQVLDALLSNAVKFTPVGGRVTLAASPAEGGGCLITLADTGIGMTPENIPRAFEAFTQLEAGLDRRYAGSGLGLYLARALTGAMGIDLTLDSTPGLGTTVTLAVPPADEVTA
ncbi:PAS domain-containing sensor histidine kinase [Roseomonas sp. KE2513]|uniref:sensor histidine kinase n=1 Tax=Roseomonas sp. KE2513 TaxID=2479202 RepID=UPI0018DF537F|nr:PAS domain-containing sensor histidine kinase [Roseomonas sp. KE2513]